MSAVHALLGCGALFYLLRRHGGRIGWALLAVSFLGCPDPASPSWHHAQAAQR